MGPCAHCFCAILDVQGVFVEQCCLCGCQEGLEGRLWGTATTAKNVTLEWVPGAGELPEVARG